MEISHYYPDGMRFESSTSNSAALPYRYNGKELEAMNGLNEYDYGARRRETGIPVWTAMDPLAEKHYNYSPYAYVYGNPIKLIDPYGLDSIQRAQAVQRGEEYVNKKPAGNQYQMAAKGVPGKKVDCSGLVSNCIRAGGEPDPNHGNKGSGVLNIESNTTKITNEADVVPGNLITFRYNKKGAYPYHVGVVKSVERDTKGNITSVTFIQSSGGDGPNIGTINVGNSGNLSIHGYYKWDTKPDVAPRNSTTTPSVVLSNSISTSIVGLGALFQDAENNFINQVGFGF